MKFLVTSFLSLLFISLSYAQPGNLDQTRHYSYTILNENGEEISFLKEKNYSIMVDDKLYQSPRIPQDKLPRQPGSSLWWGTHIHINDFSLFIPYKEEYREENPDYLSIQREIKIIHQQDTMFLHQATRKGKDRTKSNEMSETDLKSDLTLRFIPGYYHFPYWTKTVLGNLPEITGEIKIVNLRQENFIISKEIYELTPYSTTLYCSFEKCDSYKKADELVYRQFTEPFYTFEIEQEYTTIGDDLSILNPIIKSIYPTKDEHKFIGIMEYNRGLIGKRLEETQFAIQLFSLDVEKNTLDFWTIDKENTKTTTSKIYVDTFNSIFYNATIVQDTSSVNDHLYLRPRSYPFEYFIYHSLNDGETWEKNEQLTQLFNKHDIREFEFLDHEYALAYKFLPIPSEVRPTIYQGTYYLLRNLEIVDSLKSPENINYVNSYNHYKFLLKNDTIFLGNWSLENSFATNYTQPYLTKQSGKWYFQTMEKSGNRNQLFIPETEIKSTEEYLHFTLIDRQKLVSKNHYGTLDLNWPVTPRQKTIQNGTYQLVEKDSVIYLLNHHFQFLLFSDDRGLTWYLYPFSVGSYYNFGMQIEENGQITFMNDPWEEGIGRKIKKISLRFLRKEE